MLQSPAWKFFQARDSEPVIPFCLPSISVLNQKLPCDAHVKSVASSSTPLPLPEEHVSPPLDSSQLPVTPPQQIKAKVDASPGPWLQTTTRYVIQGFIL
jgi:hypothetical protein